MLRKQKSYMRMKLIFDLVGQTLFLSQKKCRKVKNRSIVQTKMTSDNINIVQAISSVFFMGMVVVVTEVIDIIAADALEYVLKPCSNITDVSEQTQELADDLDAIIDQIQLESVIDIRSGYIPIAFE